MKSILCIDSIQLRNVPPLTTILRLCTRDGWFSFYFVHKPQPAVGVVLRTIYRAAPAPCQSLYRIFHNIFIYILLNLYAKMYF